MGFKINNTKIENIHIKNNIWDLNKNKKYLISPIWYPGGKFRAISILMSLIPNNIKQMLSPFCGGGSVEFALSSFNVNVYAYDVYDRLLNFYHYLIHDNDNLIKNLYECLSYGKEDFYRLLKTPFEKNITNAAYFYYVNLCSFSGTGYSGGYSALNRKDFTKQLIDGLSIYKNINIKIQGGSFEESLIKNKNSVDFIYLDPPYWLIKKNNRLYGENGNTHKNFDHYKLKEILDNTNIMWLMSYNNSNQIKELYKDYQMIETGWAYSMAFSKEDLGKQKGKNQELLIFSKNYPEIHMSRKFKFI
ncbi:MAG: DNA adenine methylase [Candidatus Nanoarchaeia archaeon]|nr:DNA adenine methylase [Candidatus Nanoarchaeia archaeon]